MLRIKLERKLCLIKLNNESILYKYFLCLWLLFFKARVNTLWNLKVTNLGWFFEDETFVELIEEKGFGEHHENKRKKGKKIIFMMEEENPR